MRPIRVLVVDDSVVIRRMLTDILSAEDDIEVVGVAPNGLIALQKIPQLSPDVITLDVEMPEMSGLDTLVEIRKTYRALPVVMFSSLTERAAATTLEALARGATDYVTKPQGTGSREASIAHVRDELVPKIRVLGGAVAAADEKPTAKSGLRRINAAAPPPNRARVEVLAIGASTGGPNALTELFVQLPKSLRVPVVVVQHMPAVFTKLFADRLSASCALSFTEARGGEVLVPGHVYIAPGGQHLRIVREGFTVRTVLDDGPPESSCKPAVDVLFRSVVAAFGASTLAVVLTGMGQDGLRGCEAIHRAGGQIVVQDEASSVVWGMPGFVAKAGIAEATLPLPEISSEVLRRVNREARHVG